MTLEKIINGSVVKIVKKVAKLASGLAFVIDLFALPNTNAAESQIETIFSDDFESYNERAEVQNAGWKILSYGEPVTGTGYVEKGWWQLFNNQFWGFAEWYPWTWDRGTYMISFSDFSRDGSACDEELISPEVDCTNYINVKLDFASNIKIYENDPNDNKQITEVDVNIFDKQKSGWSKWTNIFHHDYSKGDDSTSKTLDISEFADRNKIKLRWHFYDTNFDYWWAIDNVTISGEYKPVVYLEKENNNIKLKFDIIKGTTYKVEKSNDLKNWVGIYNGISTGANEWSDLISDSKTFYRIKVER